MACEEGVFHGSAPAITPKSTIGAGDSMIAGFIAATAKGMIAPDCLRTAVAFGSAACLQEGTRAPDPADIAVIWEQIKIL